MAAYLNGQVQAAYLNGQSQVGYLNGQLVLGGAVSLLELFTETFNSGSVEWIGFSVGTLAEDFGSLNPDEVQGKTINGVLTSIILASGEENYWYSGPLGERLMRELGSKIHIFGPGYDAVWNFIDMNSIGGNTSYRYLPDVISKQFPSDTLLTTQLRFEAFAVINEMTAGATGDLIGYSIDDAIGSMSPDFVQGVQITKLMIDSVSGTYTVRVGAVVPEEWWYRIHTNGTGVGESATTSIAWTYTTGAGWSQWERTLFYPPLVDGEVYDAVFDLFTTTNEMTAGNQAGAIGYIRGFVGTLTPDTIMGADVESIIDNPTQDVFAITMSAVEPPDLWEKVVITGLGIGGAVTLFSSGMTYEENGVISVWSTPGLLGLQDTEDYKFMFE